MGEPAKGTVTSLSSLFPPEEVQEALKRVLDTISDHQKQLVQLRNFSADNASLISLVQKLPDVLHHDIMVPFGKAAFFPGRLIHTNEFLVLLGECYYAERTSKQTVDLLQRRGKALESQVTSLKALMRDLKAQASYFDATAAQVAEGLVEIIEEYAEETSAEEVSKAGPAKPDHTNVSEAAGMRALAKEEEFANLMSKIDELEKQELEEESGEDEEWCNMLSKLDELEKKELATTILSESDEDDHTIADLEHYGNQDSFDHKHEHQLINQPNKPKDEHHIFKELPSQHHSVEQESCKQVKLQLEGPKFQSVREGNLSSSDLSSALTSTCSVEKALVLPEVEVEKTQLRNKAFPGSIVEHVAHDSQTNPRALTNDSFKSPTPQTSKPVSRFKMQRKGSHGN